MDSQQVTTHNCRFHFHCKNTFCISLLSSVERWDRMRSRFEYFHLDVTRWIASTPDNLTDTFADYMNPGQRACSQSHMNIWRHVVSDEIPYALILEDDAQFDRQWLDKLNHACDRKCDQHHWHALFLNGSELVTPTNKWSVVTDQYLTGGYIISLSGAKQILNMFSHELWGADWMTTRLQTHGRCWSYFPWLIVQEGLESTIGSGVEADHAKVLRLLGEIDYDLSGNYI